MSTTSRTTGAVRTGTAGTDGTTGSVPGAGAVALLPAYRLTLELAWRDFRSEYPLGMLALVVLPRMVVQTFFWTLLGRVAAGPAGTTFAFVGACVQIMVTTLVINGADALKNDRLYGTAYRLRLGRVPVLGLVTVRWLVYVFEAVLIAVICSVLIGLVIGRAAVLGRLLLALPLFALLGVCAIGLGVTVASLTTRVSADTLVTNATCYLVLAVCGVVAPVPHWAPARFVADLLPFTPGLKAIRSALAGGSPWGYVLWEIALSAAWFALAAVMLRLKAERTRRSGDDDSF
ncbi:ABC transporter permease [Kitasatospora sp. NPDC048194]|uniref:ABC transporter permease n=1 Tax=Kitasatospora sp. NPDC048194 TaxID=3364045 RepID=UPI00372044C6